MSKKVLWGVLIFVTGSLLLGAFAFAATTKTFKIQVLTKDKTVFVDDREILGVLDLYHKVNKDMTITSTAEGVIVSYKGNLIEGAIKLKSTNASLEALINDQKPVTIRYLLLKEKKISEYVFSKATMTGSETAKTGKTVSSVMYRFRAASFMESNK